MRRIYLDCDGVLADFDSAAHKLFGMTGEQYEDKYGSKQFWTKLEGANFFLDLPLMPDAQELYEGVKHLNPTILTGCPRGEWAQPHKVLWARKHFPLVPVITVKSINKNLYCVPGDILVDDITRYRDRWLEKGGIYVHHTSAADSLRQIREIYANDISN